MATKAMTKDDSVRDLYDALQRLHDRAHDIAGESFLNWRLQLQEACGAARMVLARHAGVGGYRVGDVVDVVDQRDGAVVERNAKILKLQDLHTGGVAATLDCGFVASVRCLRKFAS